MKLRVCVDSRIDGPFMVTLQEHEDPMERAMQIAIEGCWQANRFWAPATIRWVELAK